MAYSIEGHRNPEWTNHEFNKLLRLWKSDTKTSMLCSMLGRSKAACHGVLWRNGYVLSRKRHREGFPLKPPLVLDERKRVIRKRRETK